MSFRLALLIVVFLAGMALGVGIWAYVLWQSVPAHAQGPDPAPETIGRDVCLEGFCVHIVPPDLTWGGCADIIFPSQPPVDLIVHLPVVANSNHGEERRWSIDMPISSEWTYLITAPTTGTLTRDTVNDKAWSYCAPERVP